MNILGMTDSEIYEIGSQVLIDRLGAAGLIRFIRQCQELNGGHPRDQIEYQEDAEENIKLYTAGLTLFLLTYVRLLCIY